jgi:hypothetical protein
MEDLKIMTFGEERLFITDCLSTDKDFYKFFLRYKGTDSDGIKMSGCMPQLWKYHNNCLTGPEICDEDGLYKVVKVDYDKEIIWLQIVSSG